MKIPENLEIAIKITIAFATPVLLMLLVNLYHIYLSFDVEKNIEQMKSERIVHTLTALKIERNVIQIQQWLTDISVTRAYAGLDKGFDKAEQHYQSLLKGLRYFRDEYQEDNNQAGIKKIDLLKSEIDDFYETGKKMAQVYITDGPENGNRIMFEFDKHSEELSSTLNLFVIEQVDEAHRILDEVKSKLNHTATAFLVIAFFVLTISTLFGYVTIRWMIQYVAQRNTAEKALKASEGNLTRAHLISKLGSWYYDYVTRTEVFSDACFKIFGMDKEDYPNNIVPHDRVLGLYATPEETSRHFLSLAEKHNVFEYEYATSPIAGEVKIIHSYCEVERSDDGKILKIFGTDQDITERRKREADLEESEERYRTLFERSSDAIFMVDSQTGKYTNANQAAEQLTGFSLAEIKTKTTKDLSPKGSEQRLSYISKLETSMEMGEVEYLRADGGKRNVILTVVPMKNNQTVGIAHDITDRIQAEKILIQAHNELERKVEERTIDYKRAKESAEAANMAKSKFLSNMSHELRTPMHHILGYAKIGIDKIDKVSKEKINFYFSRILKSGDNLLSLLNNLLDLSNLEFGQMAFEMSKNDLQNIVHTVVDENKFSALGKKVAISIEESHLPTTITCDFNRIAQVIQNLLTNAICYTPEGKSIGIFFELSEIPLVNLNSDMTLVPALVTKVKDQGVGIPEAELNTVFDKFIQSSETDTGAGGTGLGLAICKEIIEGHKGIIWAENNTEEGSTVSFLLPFNQVDC